MDNCVIILYGYSDWDNLRDTKIEHLLNGAKVIQIWELDHLKWYLYNEDLHLNKKIIPLQLDFVKQLNWICINNHIYSKDNNIIDIFDNKKLFVDYIKQNNLIEYAPTIYDTYWDEYRWNYHEVIVKEPNNKYGYGISIQKLKDLNQDIFNKCVVQEYIYSNQEYAGHLILKNGYIIHNKIYLKTINTTSDNKYILGYDCKHSFELQNVDIGKKHLDELEKFFIPHKYSGPCCVDFKIVNGELKVFEINPRFGASLVGNLNDLAKSITVLIENNI